MHESSRPLKKKETNVRWWLLRSRDRRSVRVVVDPVLVSVAWHGRHIYTTTSTMGSTGDSSQSDG